MMPTDLANKIWPEGLAGPARSDPVEAVERDIEAIRQRDSDLADSALAAAALSMAYELINPFNSATSKSMCVARLMEAMAELRELVPPAETADRLDEVAKRRDQRRHRSAGT